MTDFQLVDEESPARVEFTGKLGPPFTAAYRPQEGTGPQVVDTMVREMRDAVSPVTQRPLDAVMTTGDNTDNTQCNEARWMIDILDGAAYGGGSCVPAGLRPGGRKVEPNSGVEGTCGVARDASIYDGVRGGGEYYEPDASSGQDGPGYSPRQAENEATAQRSNSVRDFKGLFEDMNQPFQPHLSAPQERAGGARIRLNQHPCAHEAHIGLSRHRCSPVGFAACFGMFPFSQGAQPLPAAHLAEIVGNSRWRHAVRLRDP